VYFSLLLWKQKPLWAIADNACDAPYVLTEERQIAAAVATAAAQCHFWVQSPQTSSLH
jgi:hypothetical protein